MTGTKSTAAPVAILILACLAPAPALAAGGHFAVDDAALLEPGHCGAETWWTHGQDRQDLLHAGNNCRVGPVELGGAAEYSRGDRSSNTVWNLEVKWARDVAPGWSFGVDLQPAWHPREQPRHDTSRVVALATWKPHDQLAMHFNLGRDFIHGDGQLARGGVAVEWQPAGQWSTQVERYLEGRTHFLRAGLRWAASKALSVDLSRAQRLGGGTASNWTLGLNYDFRID